MESSAKANLGGAGLQTQSGHEKGVVLGKPVVNFVNGTMPLSKGSVEHTKLSHSPLKVRGKK